ncbi:MAG TPA: NAD(P)H-dependent oxidoreductase [bacterium]|nr:NAD(P)H-dependent oxidoreductase [bacterium]
MNNHPTIPVILGTARDGRESEKVAKLVAELAQAAGFQTELLDVREYMTSQTIPWWDKTPETENWQKKMAQADGLIIVTPEYNHSFPGELKILLDKAYKEYEGKPAALVGVSAGQFGGARAVEHLKQVLLKFELHPLRNAVYFSDVASQFDAQGVLINEEYRKRIAKMLDDLKKILI